MPYTSSSAFAGKSTVLNYSTNPPSVAYAPVGEVKTIDVSGTKVDTVDVTNMQSGFFKEFIPVLAEAGEVSFTGNLVPNEAGQLAIVGFLNAGTLLSFQILLAAGGTFVTSIGNYTFKGYLVGFDRKIEYDKASTFSAKIKITQQITFTAGS